MRTYTIGAATLAYTIGAATLAVAALLGACSDGSNLVGAGGSSSIPTAGAAPVSGAAGSSTTPGAGTGNSPSEGGASSAPPVGGAGPDAGGSGGAITGAGGSGGSVSGGAPGGGGAPPSGGSGGTVAVGGSGGAASGETGPFKVLIISTALEGAHDSIPTCQQLVSDLGKVDANMNNQWTTKVEGDDLADFTDAGLKAYRLIFSCNPTGVVFSGNSKVKDKAGAMKALQTYMEGGGAFAGVHSASDFEKTNGFPWFTNTLMGSYFDHHDNDGTQGSVTLDANNSTHPVLKGLSTSYSTQDEWYYMNRDVSAQPGFKILQRLAKDNRAVSWVKEIGMGRMFYTIRGHNKSVYAEKEFKTLVQNGIMWTTKRL